MVFDTKLLKGVDKRLANVILEASKNPPVTFKIQEGLRTLATQQKYFKSGVTLCDGIKKLSKHQLGKAVDLYPLPVNFENKEAFKKLANHIITTGKKMGIKIIWGGTFKNLVDMPHFEI